MASSSRRSIQNWPKKYDVTLYPLFLEGVAADPELLLQNGKHQTAERIDRMVAKAFQHDRKGDCQKMNTLQAEIERICKRLGVSSDPCKFTTDLMLARLRNTSTLDVAHYSVRAKQFFCPVLPRWLHCIDVIA